MANEISSENKLQNILDFEVCKQIVEQGKASNQPAVILCSLYSINIASRFDDCEQLSWDLDELSNYIGAFVEVSDYDDLIVSFVSED